MANLDVVDLGSKAKVRARMSYKVNLGNYENCDVEFEIEASSVSGESEGDALIRVSTAVEDLLVEKVTELKSK